MTVKLYANGVDTKETLTLSEDNNWRGSFAGLPQTVDGKMVAYTVGEAGVAHYTASVKGTPATGFTVTNTYRRPSSSSSGNTSTRSYTNTPSTRATTSMPTPKTADAADAVSRMATVALALGAALGLAGIAAKRA